jgi:hypothetical protein
MDTCETVKIVAVDQAPEAGDHVVINKADFDPEKHELYQEGLTPEQRKAERANLIARAVELKLVPDAAALAKKGTEVIRAMVDKAEKA